MSNFERVRSKMKGLYMEKEEAFLPQYDII